MSTISTLRPGLLVSLKTTLNGNVSYIKTDIEDEHMTKDGAKVAAWETRRTVTDPDEHERAVKARSKARASITRVCAQSAFGLLCPENRRDELDEAIADARKIADAFNASAGITRIGVYVIVGRVAADDVEALRAIRSEITELIDLMREGVKLGDVEMIRTAATKARSVSGMLTPGAAARVEDAIKLARDTAKEIVKAGETAAIEVDKRTLRGLARARTAFLDFSEAAEINVPTAERRTLDFAPVNQE